MRKKMNRLLLALTIALISQLDAKIRFLTFHYNRPDFLELQIRTMQKFIEDDYELFVINDAPKADVEESIRKVCEKYQITCLRYEQEWHRSHPLNSYILNCVNDSNVFKIIDFGANFEQIANQPSVRHCHLIQFALDNYGYDHNDLVIILDGDMFPIRPINIRAFQENYHVMGSVRKESKPNESVLKKYNITKSSFEQLSDMFWVTFTSLNMPLLPDKSNLRFDPYLINNVLSDTGGAFYHYLEMHPELTHKKFPLKTPMNQEIKDRKRMLQQGFTALERQLCNSLPKDAMVQFQLENHFLHYSGSSYTNDNLKSKCVKQFLNLILLENSD